MSTGRKNPAKSNFLLEVESVSGCSLTLEEAVKLVVSGGIVCPDSIVVKPLAEVMEAVA